MNTRTIVQVLALLEGQSNKKPDWLDVPIGRALLSVTKKIPYTVHIVDPSILPVDPFDDARHVGLVDAAITAASSLCNLSARSRLSYLVRPHLFRCSSAGVLGFARQWIVLEQSYVHFLHGPSFVSHKQLLHLSLLKSFPSWLS